MSGRCGEVKSGSFANRVRINQQALKTSRQFICECNLFNELRSDFSSFCLEEDNDRDFSKPLAANLNFFFFFPNSSE